VSRDIATRKEPEPRLENIEARLRTHDWVQDARLIFLSSGGSGNGHPERATALLVPSVEGTRTLRHRGKEHLIAELVRYVALPTVASAAGIDWRLIEALPAPGQEATAAVARSAQMPIVSDLVLDSGSRSLTCRLRVPYDMPVYNGHFPAVPIVPGVVLVGWAVELACIHGLVTGRVAGISAAKFRRIVQPGMSLAARLEYGARAGQLQFGYELGGTEVTTGRVRFEACHE
jgi:3-hydroxymyristoyl/3-hydroxydecanoyl-(acyl carrier protein) dehydratase